MLDYSKNTPPIPPFCTAIARRILASNPPSPSPPLSPSSSMPAEAVLNQMTVNEYLPGQGIASHTGTICRIPVG